MPAAPHSARAAASLPGSKPDFPSLTGIRILLAFWVVSYHLMFSSGLLNVSPTAIPGLLNNLLRTAYAAVETFFLLSGFILACNYRSDTWWTPKKIYNFAAARFARIYPVYALSLIFSAPFALSVLLKDHSARQLFRQTAIAAAHWSLLQSWFPSWSLEWNSPAWSLSTEVAFYCLFPAVSALLWRQSRWPLLAAIAVVFWALALVTPAVVSFGTHQYAGISSIAPHAPAGWLASFLKFYPPLRVFDFVLGICAGRFYILLQDRGFRVHGRGYFFYVPGILLYAGTASLGAHIPFFLFNNGLVAPALLLIVFGLACGGGFVDRFLSLPFMLRGGEISYCLYLMQDPLLSWLHLTSKLSPVSIPIALFVIVYIGTLIILSIAIVEKIEKPLNRIIRQRLQFRIPSATRFTTT